jgi:hypothetical protein
MKNYLVIAILSLLLINCSNNTEKETQTELPVPQYNYYYDLNGEWLSFSNSGLKEGTKGWLDEASSWSLGQKESGEDVGIKISEFERTEIQQNIFRVSYLLELKEYVGNFYDGEILWSTRLSFEYELTQEIISHGDALAGDYRESLINDAKFITSLATNAAGVGLVSSFVSDKIVTGVVSLLIGEDDVQKYEAFAIGYSNLITIQKAIYDLEQDGVLPLPIEKINEGIRLNSTLKF